MCTPAAPICWYSPIVRLTLITLPLPVSMSHSVGSEVTATTLRALSSISLKLIRPTSVNPLTAVAELEPLTYTTSNPAPSTSRATLGS